MLKRLLKGLRLMVEEIILGIIITVLCHLIWFNFLSSQKKLRKDRSSNPNRLDFKEQIASLICQQSRHISLFLRHL